MLVTKSFFLTEAERFKLEELVFKAMPEHSEAHILNLDDRELTELVKYLQMDKCHCL